LSETSIVFPQWPYVMKLASCVTIPLLWRMQYFQR